MKGVQLPYPSRAIRSDDGRPSDRARRTTDDGQPTDVGLSTADRLADSKCRPIRGGQRMSSDRAADLIGQAVRL